MAKTYYIFSTLANGQKYQNYVNIQDNPQGVNIAGDFVIIKGGAGIAKDGGRAEIWTPLGVCTEVTEEQYDILKKNGPFNDHVKRGFIKVHEKKADAEKVAADMERKDPGAPMTQADYENLPEGSVRLSEMA